MKRWSFLTSLISIALALAVFPSVQAQEETAGTIGPNVSVTITVGEVEDDGSKPNRAYKLMTRSGSSAELLMGWRTPIPTATSDAEGEEDANVTSFVYQNVGMTARIEVRVVGQGTVLLRGEVEIIQSSVPSSRGSTSCSVRGRNCA
jgi:hypothetical protein